MALVIVDPPPWPRPPARPPGKRSYQINLNPGGTKYELPLNFKMETWLGPPLKSEEDRELQAVACGLDRGR